MSFKNAALEHVGLLLQDQAGGLCYTMCYASLK